jgi:hypothetical protein
MHFPLNRREWLIATGAGFSAFPRARGERQLDRRALVRRHNPVLRAIEVRAPLSTGNGEFAFTADITGLQSLQSTYAAHLPLCTQSQWGWHSFPIPDDLKLQDFRLTDYNTYGREVGYATSKSGQETLYNWLRENPHRLNLAEIALLLDGRALDPADIAGIDQELDLWSGILSSRFHLQGRPVTVTTCCHPGLDALAVSLESPLVAARRLSLAFRFPFGSPSMSASDWSRPDAYRTEILSQREHALDLLETLDQDSYFVRLRGEGGCSIRRAGPHEFVLEGAPGGFVCHFSPRRSVVELPPAASIRAASASHWRRFWSSGAAADFSDSRDLRAQELERRLVLSQYLTAIQCAGSYPPQETGLTCNSWYGKFHLEMHWWHAAHFALWGRQELLERSLPWYASVLPSARAKARSQGYAGARWPKMADPSGRSSPSPVGELLIWQQPHPIWLAELSYRSHQNQRTLERWAELVFESAEFMASYAVEVRGRFVLGPPLIPAQENHPARTTFNPTFELAYWRQGLAMAQRWRERLGMRRSPVWDKILAHLSRLPVNDGVYQSAESCLDTFTTKNWDHPSMLCASGLLPGERVDAEIMRRTLDRVFRVWRWADTWGWDYPMVAMTAARLGDPEAALQALFLQTPKNEWLANGHVYQRPNLPVYLPANGALLSAIALMVSLGAFPKKGWSVKAEGLRWFE